MTRRITQSPRSMQIGEVVQFIPKRDLERARLIQQARAIYESIFPTENPHFNNRVMGRSLEQGTYIASKGKTNL